MTVKAIGYGVPSEAELRQMDRAVEMIRLRYHRWTRRRLSSILAGIRDELSALDDPTDADIMAAVMRADPAIQDTLARMLRGVYPPAAALAVPDEVSKAWTLYERKAEDQRLRQLIERLIGRTIVEIDSTTLAYIRRAYAQADGDVQVFRTLLLSSPALSPARARTIAVTETNIAINDSIYQASEEHGRDRERIMLWRTTMRLNVRDTHRLMEGVTVPFGDFFHVPLREGGYDLMLHPGDTMHGAHAENLVNCYCKGFPRYV